MHMSLPSSTRGARPATRRGREEGRKEGRKGGVSIKGARPATRRGRKDRRRANASFTSSPPITNLQELGVGSMQLGVDAIMVLGKGRRACSGRGGGGLLHCLPLPTLLLLTLGNFTLTRRRQGSGRHGGGSGCCHQGKEGWRAATTTAGSAAAAMHAAGSAAGGSAGGSEGQSCPRQNDVMRPSSERRQGQGRRHDAQGLWLCVCVCVCIWFVVCGFCRNWERSKAASPKSKEGKWRSKKKDALTLTSMRHPHPTILPTGTAARGQQNAGRQGRCPPAG
jgi:hypothetical protein